MSPAPTPRTPLRVRLSWHDPSTGEPREQIIPLPVTIGRANDNTLPLNSNRVSRRHARIEVEGDRVSVADLNSSNGTFLNQQRISGAPLADGDLLQIGPFALAIDIEPFRLTPGERQLVLRWRDPQNGQQREIELAPPFSIGRMPYNDVVLAEERVSRCHALVSLEEEQFIIHDQNSSNGLFVNGRRHERAVISPGDVVRIGPFDLSVTVPPLSTRTSASQPSTLVFGEQDELAPTITDLPAVAAAFPPPAFAQPRVAVSDLRAGGLEIDETTYLALGGGLGSFTWVDHLRIFGVPTDAIVAIGLEEKPYGRYERLCIQSQIPAHERLRSDSGSTPDNLWGWPGYGVREIWQALTRAQLMQAFRVAWQLFGEPTLDQTYTPRSGDVFQSIDREAKRIGWSEMWRFGHIKAIRKTDDGRYAVAYTRTSATETRHCVIVAPYVHLAVGYPGVRFLDDLQRYREETGDFKAVVNAYEQHEHVYEDLLANGGVVMLRGRGIVASRILQRIYETRRENQNIAILHLLRSPLAEGHRYGRTQRPVENHWEFQPFNWPKACWGGELRVTLEQADDEGRDQLLNDWGGTTTADRRDWRQMVGEGMREGWYQIRFGTVEQVVRDADGDLVTKIRGRGAISEEMSLQADYIIDCTGLTAQIDANPLLKDLLAHHNLERNPKGRLAVANDFALRGMDNGEGRMYAGGAMTLGGPHAAVDSFLGLQYSALRAVDALHGMRAPHIRGLNNLRSLWQWLRWARGVAP